MKKKKKRNNSGRKGQHGLHHKLHVRVVDTAWGERKKSEKALIFIILFSGYFSALHLLFFPLIMPLFIIPLLLPSSSVTSASKGLSLCLPSHQPLFFLKKRNKKKSLREVVMLRDFRGREKEDYWAFIFCASGNFGESSLMVRSFYYIWLLWFQRDV